jgi:hypothetical protein
MAVGFLWNFFRLKSAGGTGRMILGCASLGVSVLLVLMVAWLAFEQGGERYSGLIVSPDGTHVARIMITSGTIADSKYSSVIVRRVWSLNWRRAYYGFGYFQEGGPVEPYLHWADSKHLVVDYQQSSVDPSSCPPRVDDIVVECRAHDW